MTLRNRNDNKGFTLIELLVAIAIIGILSAVVLTSLGSVRGKARDAVRKAELNQMQTALEYYYDKYGVYPSTGGSWWGMSANGGSRARSGANAYIPGLTPTYMAELPADPLGDTTGWSGYLYLSDGTNYKLLSHANGPESFPTVSQPLYDPIRPTWAWMVCSKEPACSTW